ncbi:MAG: lactoylglutathione lyase [Frankiales bacterium]|nr:lactoylglutathione lyase [Frankiales bacterium]
MPPLHHAAICTGDLERARRFWQDGLGLVEFFDHEFTGDWPTLFGASTNRLRSVFLGDRDHPDAGIVELVAFIDGDDRGNELAANADAGPQTGFFLLSFNVDVEAALQRLVDLGFVDGVRRISVPAGGGKQVPMAVVRAPDAVLVELIGPAH